MERKEWGKGGVMMERRWMEGRWKRSDREGEGIGIKGRGDVEEDKRREG